MHLDQVTPASDSYSEVRSSMGHSSESLLARHLRGLNIAHETRDDQPVDAELEVSHSSQLLPAPRVREQRIHFHLCALLDPTGRNSSLRRMWPLSKQR